MSYKNNLVEILISFFLYWVFFSLIGFIPSLKSGPITYFVFMPAGIKLFSVLIFRWRGALGTGLAIFTRLMLTNNPENWGNWLLVAVSVSVVLYLVVELGLRTFKTNDDLDSLTYLQIVTLATVASIVNGLVYAYTFNGLSISQIGDGALHTGFLTIMGNFAGNAVFVCSAIFLLRHQEAIKAIFSRLKSQ